MRSTSHEEDDASFTEMESLSELKSVPSSTVASSGTLMHTSESEYDDGSGSEEGNDDVHHKRKKWPDFKIFRNRSTGEEVIYGLIDTNSVNFYTNLLTISSISLFVASNFFAFTLGLLVGRQFSYEY